MISAKILYLTVVLSCMLFSCRNQKAEKNHIAGSESDTFQSSSPVTANASSPMLEENLRSAAMEGNMTTIEYLLSRNVNVKATDTDGRTAMMLAAFNGHTGIVKALLDRGSPVDTRDNAGRTALIYASTGPYPETVKFLLSRNADPNIADSEDKFTAIMFAASEGQIEVVRVLLANKADPLLKDKDNDNAETFARRNGHNEIAALLKRYSGVHSK